MSTIATWINSFFHWIVDMVRCYYGPACLTTDMILNVITIWSIVSFMHTKRTNPKATILAILLASSNGYMFFQRASGFAQLSQFAELGLVVYTACVTLICVAHRGNMATALRSVWWW